MSKFAVREARRKDIDEIFQVLSEADQLHREVHPEIFRQAKFDHTIKEYYRSCISDPKYAIFLAEDKKNVIGAMICSINNTPENPILVPRKYATIENISVLTAYRKTGVGKALMARAQQWAKAIGASSIDLTVWDFNTGAIEFYNNLGYRTIHHKMRKDLK